MDLQVFSLKQNSLFKCRLQPSAAGWARALPAPPQPPPATNGCGEGEDGGGICLSKPPRCSSPSFPPGTHFGSSLALVPKGSGAGKLRGAGGLGPASQHHPCRVQKTSEHRLCLFPSSLWIRDSMREEPRGLRSDSKHQEKALLDQTAEVKLKSKSI